MISAAEEMQLALARFTRHGRAVPGDRDRGQGTATSPPRVPGMSRARLHHKSCGMQGTCPRLGALSILPRRGCAHVCRGRWSEKKLRSHSQATCPSSQSVGATARFQPVVMEVTTLFPGPAIFVTFLGLLEASWGPVPQHSGTAASLSAQFFHQLSGGRTSWERGSLSPYRHQSDFSSCSGGPEQKGRISERETPNTPGVPTSISPAHQPGVMALRPVGPGGRPGSAPCPHCPTAGAGSGPHPALPDRVPAEGAVTFVSWALLCVQPGLQRGMEESLSLRRLAEGAARVSAHPSACKSCQELCRAAYLNPKSFFSY